MYVLSGCIYICLYVYIYVYKYILMRWIDQFVIFYTVVVCLIIGCIVAKNMKDAERRFLLGPLPPSFLLPLSPVAVGWVLVCVSVCVLVCVCVCV
jgi:hypothetical protein